MSVVKPLTLAQVREVTRKYAPIVRHVPNEPFHMCSIEWYLEHATLYGPDGYRKEKPTIEDLPTNPRRDDDDESWWLIMKDSVKPGDWKTAKAYVRARWDEGKNYTDIQYWFSYGYNGPGTLNVSNPIWDSNVSLAPLGEHWVDFEMVTIRVSNETLQPLGVFLSQHGGGDWITDLGRFKRKGDQFIVYASRNGHALYHAPGLNPTSAYDWLVVKFCLRNDTEEGGHAFDAASSFEIVSSNFLSEVTEPRWLNYHYRWAKGTGTHLTVDTIVKVLLVVLPTIAWLGPLSLAVISGLALALLPVFQFDDTNGVYGPKMQKGYWDGTSLPKWHILPGNTGNDTNKRQPPCIVCFKGQLHIFHIHKGGNAIYHITSRDGKTWQHANPHNIGIDSSGGPCAVVVGDELHLFYRHAKGNAILHAKSTDGFHFANCPGSDFNTLLDCFGQPHAAHLPGVGTCVVALEKGARQIRRTFQAVGRTDWEMSTVGADSKYLQTPSIIAFNGHFHMFHIHDKGNAILHLVSSNGREWQQANPHYTRHDSSAGPAVAHFDNALFLLYRDPKGNGLFYSVSRDGLNFGGEDYCRIDIDHEPSAAALDARLCAIGIHHLGDAVMRSVFEPW